MKEMNEQYSGLIELIKRCQDEEDGFRKSTQNVYTSSEIVEKLYKGTCSFRKNHVYERFYISINIEIAMFLIQKKDVNSENIIQFADTEEKKLLCEALNIQHVFSDMNQLMHIYNYMKFNKSDVIVILGNPPYSKHLEILKSVINVVKESIELYNNLRPHLSLEFFTPNDIHKNPQLLGATGDYFVY